VLHFGASYVEAAVVVDCQGDAVASREFDRFMRRAAIEVEPLTFGRHRLRGKRIAISVRRGIQRG